MSGIVGIVDYRHPPQQEHVRMLSAQVADRGRDAKDFFAMQSACFGYRKKQYHANQESIVRIGDWILMFDCHDQVVKKSSIFGNNIMSFLPHIKEVLPLLLGIFKMSNSISLVLPREVDHSIGHKKKKNGFCSASTSPIPTMGGDKAESEHLAEWRASLCTCPKNTHRWSVLSSCWALC